MYRRHFLRRSLAKAYDCRKSFYAYHQGLEGELGVSKQFAVYMLHGTREAKQNLGVSLVNSLCSNNLLWGHATGLGQVSE